MFTQRELDGKTMKIKDFLSIKSELPRCFIYINDGTSLRKVSEDQLKTHKWSDTGTFYVYEDDDGSFFDISPIIRKELWFVVKERRRKWDINK